jgi:hypothetical protein
MIEGVQALKVYFMKQRLQSICDGLNRRVNAAETGLKMEYVECSNRGFWYDEGLLIRVRDP